MPYAPEGNWREREERDISKAEAELDAMREEGFDEYLDRLRQQIQKADAVLEALQAQHKSWTGRRHVWFK